MSLKRANKWLKKNQHLSQWIMAFVALVLILPTIYSWASGMVKFPFFPIATERNNTYTVYYPTSVSCAISIKNDTEYKKYIDDKCKDLPVGKSLNVSTEEISKFFSLSPNSQITRFSITKNIDMNCTVSGNCLYSISVTDNINIRG